MTYNVANLEQRCSLNIFGVNLRIFIHSLKKFITLRAVQFEFISSLQD